ncbi:phosphotransferase [Nocardia brasiliensis]|nr:phosphotransferase [Nocardia brasiliensis]
MMSPLEDLDHSRLDALLRCQYGAADVTLDFVPYGGDSWQYRSGDLWVSVRRDLRGHIVEAYEGARLLEESGLAFVLAPLRGVDGRVSRMLGDRPLLVSKYEPVREALSLSATEIGAVIEMLNQVHRSTPAVELLSEDFELSFADDIIWAMRRADSTPPHSGPFSAPLTELIRSHRTQLRALRAELSRLAETWRVDKPRFVLTHGEPGTGNILRRPGGLMLGDWGELMWGPPERDWFHLRRSFGAAPEADAALMRFYEIRWFFNEFTEYAVRFFGEHEGNEEDAAMWENLIRCFTEIEI